MADQKFESNLESYGTVNKENYSKMKNGLKLPSSLKRRVSLSDIIAATIGEEARSCDSLYTDNDQTFFTGRGNNSKDREDISGIADLKYEPTNSKKCSNLKTENSNNACDLYNGFGTKQNDFGADIFKDFSFSDKQNLDFENKNVENGFTPTIGFDTEMDFLSSLFTPEGNMEPQDISTCQTTGVLPKADTPISEEGHSTQVTNTSYDSDLEDSMHFVDPDEASIQTLPDDNLESLEPISKKQRVSLHDSNSCPFPITSRSFSDGNQDILSSFNDDLHGPVFRMNGITRTRSFSGNIKPKLSRQSGKCNLLNRNSEKTPNFGRTRSFSEACNRDDLSPLGDSSFNTSLSSLLESPENSPLSNNPFFSDLKSLLILDCKTIDCPKTLFETLSNKPKQDVYARERNLQSKFSSLQGKYPDEVRELSSFYRQQSAEVETERLKEIHDDNMPISYRNHLNSYYDNQLHMIMERVDKSLNLLSIAKREIITINRPFKSRPLLSRKAVKMMEEWYSRNYEHPYPGPTAVEALAKAGEITNEQVKKWFANKRNRCKNTKPVPEIANMKRKRQFSARW
ncbi:homeobox protein 4-like [Mercenaria mercenaria]|uniref:homeobox protein 4-like n=1 Tax=Mercenaria mercenaria TaxID=6596 RepID=UPI00234F8676|nr:homeobox protein 4-like [Mercenaria mercenaria]